jgi:hypothetical protein
MSAKEVKFSVDARDRMLRGIDTLTHAVGPFALPRRAVGRRRLALQHVRPRMDNIIAGAVMRAPHADAVASHRFAAGHMVRLSRAIPLRNAAAGNYEVLAQLPERDGDLQYRIKSDREPYQRIVKEGDLETA